jgi:hypothetical protein
MLLFLTVFCLSIFCKLLSENRHQFSTTNQVFEEFSVLVQAKKTRNEEKNINYGDKT